MAYESALCRCPQDDGRLSLLDHLPTCPDYISPEELEAELEAFRRDAAMHRAQAPEPPRELKVRFCMVCGKPYLKWTDLRKCHFSGQWVLEGRHYLTYTYALTPDALTPD